MDLFIGIWIPTLGKLQKHVLPGVNVPSNSKVVDYVEDLGCLNWSLLKLFFPHDILERFRSYHPPRADFRSDSCSWRKTSTGNFTVKPAYQSLFRLIVVWREKYGRAYGILLLIRELKHFFG